MVLRVVPEARLDERRLQVDVPLLEAPLLVPEQPQRMRLAEPKEPENVVGGPNVRTGLLAGNFAVQIAAFGVASKRRAGGPRRDCECEEIALRECEEIGMGPRHAPTKDVAQQNGVPGIHRGRV
jgi:hypothetical protein